MAKAMSEAGAVAVFVSPKYRYDVFEGTWRIGKDLYVTDQLDLAERISGCWVSCYSTSPFCTIERIERAARHNRVIYEYVDHFDPTISGSYLDSIRQTYQAVTRTSVGLFLATARRLEDELADRFGRDAVIRNPNGTEIAHFRKAIATREPVPEMEAILEDTKSAPIVGYYGALAQWLDYEVIAAVARRLPRYSFVFIGPPYDVAMRLPSAPNLHWIGEVPYTRLPRFARYFDVAWIPFKSGDIAKTTSPLKLFEYFALEKPVVVNADMEECLAFDVVRGATTADEYVEALTRAYRTRSDAGLMRALRIAAEDNSWSVRGRELLTAISSTPRRGASEGFADIALSIRSGNLEVGRREPPCQLLRDGTQISFGMTGSTLMRGDFVEASIIAPKHPGRSRWRIIYSAQDVTDGVRFRQPFAIQLFLDGEIALDDVFGASPRPVEIGFHSGPGTAPVLRVLALQDLPEPWGWGAAGTLTVTEIAVQAAEGGSSQVDHVSSLSAVNWRPPPASVPPQREGRVIAIPRQDVVAPHRKSK